MRLRSAALTALVGLLAVPAGASAQQGPEVVEARAFPVSVRSGTPVDLFGEVRDRDASGGVEWHWDLDGDGVFEEGDGTSETTDADVETSAFTGDGEHFPVLRVRDANGRTAARTARVVTHEANFAPAVAPWSVFNVPDHDGLVRVGTPVELSGFTQDDERGTLRYELDVDGDGFDDAFPLVFSTPGRRTVRVRVVDAHGASTIAARTLDVASGNRAPRVRIVVQPARVGRTADLDAVVADDTPVRYYPRGGPIASPVTEWDTDDDGEFDDRLPRITMADGTPRKVRVRVTDEDGASTVAETVVRPHVGNTPPSGTVTSRFGNVVRRYEVVELDAKFVDDGWPQAAVPPRPQWDLDDDGEFDDAADRATTYAFATAGTHRVRVRTTDDDGATTVLTRELTVVDRTEAEPPADLSAPAPVPPPPPPTTGSESEAPRTDAPVADPAPAPAAPADPAPTTPVTTTTSPPPARASESSTTPPPARSRSLARFGVAELVDLLRGRAGVERPGLNTRSRTLSLGALRVTRAATVRATVLGARGQVLGRATRRARPGGTGTPLRIRLTRALRVRPASATRATLRVRLSVTSAGRTQTVVRRVEVPVVRS